MELIPIYLIFIPIVTSMIIYIFNNKYINYLIFIAQSVISILIFIYYNHFDSLTTEKNLYIGGWSKAIGISLRNDKLSFVFIILSLFIWWVIIIYCWNKRKEDFKFLFFLMFLEGAFLGLIQTNDIFNLFIFIEIITIISTILITYKKDGYSIRAGLYYLLFNASGMIFYLLGLILLYVLTGTLNMNIISTKLSFIKSTSAVKLAYIFIMASIGVKSAFFPVYNWLPRAHSAAPASVSALLSGLLVKSGLYAFIRLNEMFQLYILEDFFFILGFLTALSGVIFALSQKDIKQILAFHTISQIGIILMGLSYMEGKAYIGGMLHLFNHALFKSLLFLASGALINQYGTRKITEIRGVFKNFPVLSILMIIGILSITGSPFFNGFVSKNIIKYGIDQSSIKVFLLYIVNIGTATSFIKMSQIFFGNTNIKKYVDLNGIVSIGLLALACIFLGNFFSILINKVFAIDLKYFSEISLKNWLNYFITISLSVLIYKLIIAKDYKIIKKIRHLHISFSTTNIMLIFFIFIMIVWCRIL
jgi:multicomponent Na+:H+ antiporter subunit D